MTKEQVHSIHQEKTRLTDLKELILFNDEFNTFDFVIDTLIEVCEMESLQAEQVTFIVHYKGKCGVKSGSPAELKPAYNEMINRGLTVSIE